MGHVKVVIFYNFSSSNTLTNSTLSSFDYILISLVSKKIQTRRFEVFTANLTPAGDKLTSEPMFYISDKALDPSELKIKYCQQSFSP